MGEDLAAQAELQLAQMRLPSDMGGQDKASPLTAGAGSTAEQVGNC